MHELGDVVLALANGQDIEEWTGDSDQSLEVTLLLHSRTTCPVLQHAVHAQSIINMNDS